MSLKRARELRHDQLAEVAEEIMEMKEEKKELADKIKAFEADTPIAKWSQDEVYLKLQEQLADLGKRLLGLEARRNRLEEGNEASISPQSSKGTTFPVPRCLCFYFIVHFILFIRFSH